MDFITRFIIILVWIFVFAGLLLALLGICVFLFGEDWGIAAYCVTLLLISAGIIAKD